MPIEPEQLRIYLLGDFRVYAGGQAVEVGAWRLRKAKSLVKLLALAPGHRLHRDQVLDILWPELEPVAAKNSLHQALHVARRALQTPGEKNRGYLLLQDDLLSLCPNRPLWIDVEAFESMAAIVRREGTPSAYREALDLYSADLLPEELYEDWASLRRQSLRSTYIELLLELAQLHEAHANHRDAIELLQRALLADPLLENAHVGLMRLYALTGQRQQALRQYETLRDSLQQELEAEPIEATRLLYEAIQSGKFPFRGSPGGEPDSIGQPSDPRPTAIPGAQPGAQSGIGTPIDAHGPPTNLPAPFGSFIGRELEKREVKRLLSATRLLTITGPGGCGKTRLSLEVANELRDGYSDGVWLVELAPLSEPGQLPKVVASALGLVEASDQPVTTLLINYIKPRQLLLILDNCEHVIDTCARLVEKLLPFCPDLRVLATSRESLHVSGEVTWLVPSLSLPDRHHPPPIEELVRFEAIRLFMDRASSTLSTFELTPQNAPAVIEVCHRLDGIPLALELAAARIKALTVEQIAERLDDCFRLLTGGSRTGMTRQQTLKAALDWSFDLLAPPEQTLFNRLSVFTGSFDLNGAEAVCSGGEAPAQSVAMGQRIDIPQTDVLDLLAQLVDKSLVMAKERGNQMRYHLLEPIRQYARDRLREVGETANIQNRHLRWYAALAEQSAPELWGADQMACLDRLDLEHDNLQVALGWGIEQGSEKGLKLGTALWQFWVLRGHLAQGRQWLERLLARHPQPGEQRAEVLLGACALSLRLFDNNMALFFAFERLSVYESMGYLEGMADACYLIGSLMWTKGDNASSRLRLLQSRELALQAGSKRAIACATHALGVLATHQGDYAQAELLMRESVSLLSEIEGYVCVSRLFVNFGWIPTPFIEYGAGHTMYVGTLLLFRDVRATAARAYALANHGNLAHMRYDTTRARALLNENSDLFQELNDSYGLAQVLRQSGTVAISEGEYAQAGKLLQRSLDICTQLKDGRGISLSLHNLACLDLALGHHEAASERLEASLDILGDMGDRPGGAMVLKLQGYLAMDMGDYEGARALAEETATFYKRTGDSLSNRQWVAYALLDGAIVARLQGDFSSALAYLQESIGVFREENIVTGIAATLYQLGCVAAGMRDLETARTHYAESLACFRQLDDRLGMAFVCEDLAMLLVHKDPARAVRLAGAASARRGTLPSPLFRAARPDLETALETARQALGKSEFATAWRAGRAYSPDEVTAEIVDIKERDNVEEVDKLRDK